jgi:pyruvate dehydrogenase E2 component (dihydrolipoamide acetyltransferase)
MAYEATDDIVIAKLLVGEGTEIKVGQPMMITVEEGTDISAFANYEAPAVVAAPVAPAPPAAVPVAAASIPAASPVAAPVARASGARVFASPLARKLAREAGVDISTLSGTGPNGRIIASDVRNAPAGGSVKAASVQRAVQAAVTTSIGSTGVYSDFELSDLALGVAARYTHAKQVVPHYYLSVDLNLTKMLDMRNDFGGNMDTTTFFMKAAACAMKDVPDVNGSWMDSFVRRYEQVDINLIMGSGDGLVTPVIRDVGGKGLQSLSSELTDLEDSLFADDEGNVVANTAELAPGTFSIHDLGMFGIKAAAPIVLPPQACALALGTITDTVIPHPVTKWATAPVMTVTLSVDHRVVDGAVAAQWLASFKTLVENPVGLML